MCEQPPVLPFHNHPPINRTKPSGTPLTSPSARKSRLKSKGRKERFRNLTSSLPAEPSIRAQCMSASGHGMFQSQQPADYIFSRVQIPGSFGGRKKEWWDEDERFIRAKKSREGCGLWIVGLGEGGSKFLGRVCVWDIEVWGMGKDGRRRGEGWND